MTTFGWIVISALSIAVMYMAYNLIQEYVLNKKLHHFKNKINGTSMKVTQVILFKKAYQVALAMMLVFTLSVSGIFEGKTILDNDKVMTQANTVGSRSKLLSLLGIQNDFFNMIPESSAGDLDSAEKSRDFIDTNVQVQGVDEADIIKTDGDYIYYASRYYQKINVVYINDDYEAEVQESIDLGDVYTENMYLTKDYVIIIGYTYEQSPYNYETDEFWFGWYYQQPTGTVVVIDRNTNEIAYEVETDSYFFDHRVIDDVMYLVSTKYINQEDDELRPTFIETKDGVESTSFISYDDIYYYDDVRSTSLTVITTINLSDFTYNAQAFVGLVNHIYVNEDSLYTAYNYYDYQEDSQTSNYYAKIVKFALNPDEQTITYQGAQTIEGFIQDSYWMDEYNGYLRVVTSTWWPTKNRLFILEEDEIEDKLNIVSKIDEDLGLENETVKSVRFNKDYAQVVTFEQTDPLYTIDLTDPKNPFMHVWNEDHYLVGFGFDADASGRVTGLKLSAYDTRLEDPIDTYSFASDEEAGFSYSFSEAIYNPRALMVDANRGIIGFPMSLNRYTLNDYYYESAFVIFFIDFDSDDIISEPIFIRHDQTDYYMSVDRGIFIENITNDVVTDRYIYTFSYEQIVVYHIESNAIIQTIKLNDSINA